MNVNLVILKWVELAGDAQVDPFAQLLLASEIKPPPPKWRRWLKSRYRRVVEWRPGWWLRYRVARDLKRWEKFVFPVFRDVTPCDVMSDLVGIQPMTEPASAVFFMDFKRDEPEPLPACGPGEVVKLYKYGGCLAERGGFFVVAKANPRRVLRYQQTWLS